MEDFEERNAVYEGMVQHSQQHVAPCVKGVEWGLGTHIKRFENGGSVLGGIPVEVTQKAGVVPRCIRAVIGTLF